jgi:hypothetical protein
MDQQLRGLLEQEVLPSPAYLCAYYDLLRGFLHGLRLHQLGQVGSGCLLLVKDLKGLANAFQESPHSVEFLAQRLNWHSDDLLLEIPLILGLNQQNYN